MTQLNANYLNFLIVRAPLKQVTAATGGIMRADGNGATISDDTRQPDMRAMTPKGRYDLRKYALVAPIGKAVLVEFCYMHNMGLGLSMMLPEVEVLSFRSNWETKTRGYDQFKVYLGGEVVRMLDVEQGWETTRLTVTEEGMPHPVEPAERPRSKRKWLDQDALLEMAERAAPGSRQAMKNRTFDKSTAFSAFSSLGSPRDDISRERTTLYQAEYVQARRLGIGEDEKGQAAMKEQNDWLDHVDTLSDYMSRFIKGINRAKSDPVKVRKLYDQVLEDGARPTGFIPPPEMISAVLDRAGDPEALAYLDAEVKLWRLALEKNWSIQHTIWANPDYADRDLAETDDVPAQAVLALKSGVYDDIEVAVRHEASRVLIQAGIAFEPEDTVLSKQATFASMAGHIVSGNAEFERSMNDDVTSDLKITAVSAWRLPGKK